MHRRRLGTSGTSRTSQTGQARWTSPCIPASPLTESNKLDSHPSNPVTTTTALGRSPSSGNSNGSSELEPLTKTALTKSQSEASAQQPRAYFALASQVRMRQDETTMDNKPAAAGQSAFAGFRHSSVALQSNEPRTATQATTLERPTGPSPLLPSASDPRASSHVRARLAGRSAMARPSSRTRRESADAVGGTPSCNTAAASHMPLEIGAWVPEAVAEAYRSSGLTHIFVWQAECLALRCFEDGVNLLVSAPTSAGKTLLAEILLFRLVDSLHAVLRGKDDQVSSMSRRCILSTSLLLGPLNCICARSFHLLYLSFSSAHVWNGGSAQCLSFRTLPWQARS